MKDKVLIGMLRTYVNTTLVGMGALKGAPCQISSIIDTGTSHVVTFSWEDNDGVTHTSTLTLVDGADNVSELKDVDIASLQDGQVLVYNAETQKWKNVTNSATVASIENVGDITITNLVNGQILTWDDTASKWVNTSLGTAAKKDSTSSVTQNDSKLVESGGVFTAIDNAVKALDVTDSAVTGSYVTAVSETDGKISVTREAADAAPTEDSNKLVKSGGVYIANRNIYEVMGKMGAKNLIYVEDFTLIKSSARTKSLTTEDFGNDIPKTQVTLSFEVSDSNLTVNGEFRAYAPLVNGVRELLGGVPYMADGTYSFSFDATKLDQLYIFINNEDETTATCKIGNVMIRFANDSDATYQPYAKTNQELTKDVAGITDNINQLGAKNLIPFPYDSNSATINGVTFTINDNGSVTVNGTATAGTYFYLKYHDSTTPLRLAAGEKYIFSGLQNSDDGAGVANKLVLFLSRVNGELTWVNSTSSALDRTLTITTNSNITIAIYVKNGETVSNFTFYPMIRLASNTDPTYQPYAKTNRELTEETNDISSAIDERYIISSFGSVEVTASSDTYASIGIKTLNALNTVIAGIADDEELEVLNMQGAYYGLILSKRRFKNNQTADTMTILSSAFTDSWATTVLSLIYLKTVESDIKWLQSNFKATPIFSVEQAASTIPNGYRLGFRYCIYKKITL